MTRTILCGTDLLESGARVADHAAQFAKDLDLGLCLVHGYAGVPPVDPLTDHATRHAAQLLHDRLEADHDELVVAIAAERARLEAHGAQVTSARLVVGAPHEVLVREAIGLNARFVAVGAHTRRGALADRFFGSTADHVLRHAPCPVLVAPSGPAAPASLKGRVILVGIDGEAASLGALTTALEIAAEASGSVEAIYVGDQASVVDRAVAHVRTHAAQAHLAAAFAGVRRTPPEGSPEATLVEVATRTQAALLAVGTKGRSGIEHAVLGSVAEALCRRASVPVLVVRANGRR